MSLSNNSVTKLLETIAYKSKQLTEALNQRDDLAAAKTQSERSILMLVGEVDRLRAALRRIAGECEVFTVPHRCDTPVQCSACIATAALGEEGA